MKYTWEKEDIVGGRIVTNDSECKFDLCICYGRTGVGDWIGVCHIGSDGLVLKLGNKRDVADYLNKNNYRPTQII